MEYLIDPTKKTTIEISPSYILFHGYIPKREENMHHFYDTNKWTQLSFKLNISFKQEGNTVFKIDAANSQPFPIIGKVLSTFKEKDVFDDLLNQEERFISDGSVKELLEKELTDFYLYIAKFLLRKLTTRTLNTEFSDAAGNTQSVFLTSFTLPDFVNRISRLNTVDRGRYTTFNLLKDEDSNIGMGKVNVGSMSIQFLCTQPSASLTCSLWDLHDLTKKKPSRQSLLRTIRGRVRLRIYTKYSPIGIDLSNSNCQMIRLEHLDFFSKLDKETQLLLIKLIVALKKPLLYLHFVEKRYLNKEEYAKIESAINLIIKHGNYKIISHTPNIPTNASTQRHLLLSQK